MKNNIEAAYDNLEIFNLNINTKITDNISHPVNSYDESIRSFAENTYVTSFENIIFHISSVIYSRLVKILSIS